MSLYFGDFTSAVSVFLVLVALAYIVLTMAKHSAVEYWRRRIAVLTVLGLVVCCFVAARDGYQLSVQSSFDETVSAELFTLNSIQSVLCCIGGGVIAFSSISSIFVKNKKYHKAMFFILSFAFIFKTLVIEISR